MILNRQFRHCPFGQDFPNLGRLLDINTLPLLAGRFAGCAEDVAVLAAVAVGRGGAVVFALA